MLLAIAVSGCADTKENQTDISQVVTPVETDRPDIVTPTERETASDKEEERCDGRYYDENGCDIDTYHIDECSGITYIGSVPNIECRKIQDPNRIVFGISLYNPEEDETERDVEAAHIDAVKMTCTYYADGRKCEKEYSPVRLTRSIDLDPGESCTLRVSSGNVLRDLGMEKDDGPIFCWIGLLDNGEEEVAIEIETESQRSGDAVITRIGETDLIWD